MVVAKVDIVTSEVGWVGRDSRVGKALVRCDERIPSPIEGFYTRLHHGLRQRGLKPIHLQDLS